MDMNTATLPKKGLKTRPYNIGMEKKGLKKYDCNVYMDMNTMTLPKKGLKTRHYSKDMSMDNNVATLPKNSLKTRPYNIGMEKKGSKKYDYNVYIDMEKEDLKKLSKGQLIRLLLKQKKSKMVSNHEDLLDNNPFKDEVAQEPAKPRTDRPPKPTRKPPSIPQVEDHIINVPVPKIKELNKALKGHAKSYGIELQDNLNPLNHFTKTKTLVKSTFRRLIERHERV